MRKWWKPPQYPYPGFHMALDTNLTHAMCAKHCFKMQNNALHGKTQYVVSKEKLGGEEEDRTPIFALRMRFRSVYAHPIKILDFEVLFFDAHPPCVACFFLAEFVGVYNFVDVRGQ